MNQQPLNLRRSAQIVRRYKYVVGGVALLGAIAGAGYTALNPPMLTSQALVVIPVPKPNITTHVLIAGSTPVLTRALTTIGSGTTLEELNTEITVKSVTPNVISISATEKTAKEAETDANAVAASYVSFIGSTASPVGAVSARVLVSASTATSSAPLKQLITYGVLGALLGALAGFVFALQRNRSDRRLRSRNEIANSIGVPVLGTISTSKQADAGAWAGLLTGYEPDAVQAWTLRTVLEWLRVAGEIGAGRCAVTAVSLSSDAEALAIGPQLAVFASSLGISTALVICAQPQAEEMAVLRAACAAWSHGQSTHLQVIVANDAEIEEQPPNARLIIFVAAIDEDAPRVPAVARYGAAILAVTAGAATAEQLARSATAVADARGTVVGIMVANPDPGDASTGYSPSLGRQTRRPPAKVNGSVAEGRGRRDVGTNRVVRQ